jgi:outer membrane receptor protein involved in Fe transport
VNLAFGGTTRIWKFTDVQFTVAANNLLDAVYFDNLSRLRYYGIANPGRNIVLSVKVPFSLK